MAIGDAVIHVECDKCGFVSDPYGLTSLAGGGWDDRALKKKLIGEGWDVDGAVTICPDCVEIETGPRSVRP